MGPCVSDGILTGRCQRSAGMTICPCMTCRPARSRSTARISSPKAPRRRRTRRPPGPQSTSTMAFGVRGCMVTSTLFLGHFSRISPPHATPACAVRHVLADTFCSCVMHADWCLQFDGMPDSRLQAAWPDPVAAAGPARASRARRVPATERYRHRLGVPVGGHDDVRCDAGCV